MPELNNCTGYGYLLETFHDREKIREFRRPAIAEVKPFKTYPGAEKVELPRQWQTEEEKLSRLLQQRRSLRRYANRAMPLQELAFMLWASQGITALSGNYSFRTAPSGGALYPVETYLSVHTVVGLEPGLYHFDVENFALDRLSRGDSGRAVARACLNQQFMARAGIIFIWSAVFRRCMSKYGNRGMRYILLDAGHICQNTLLAAEATGSGGCPVAAFFDNEMNELLDINPEEESVIYAASVGKKP